MSGEDHKPAGEHPDTGAPADHQKTGEPAALRAGRPRAGTPPLIPARAAEDSDTGWGRDEREHTDEWYESERPPHW